MKPEQVLAAFEARMELDELHAYKEEVERVIMRPQRDYKYVGCPGTVQGYLDP